MWAKIFALATGALWWNRTGFPEDEKYSECRWDWAQIYNGLKKNETWAFKILDSWTKLPSGILTGHLVDYGNYDECVHVEGAVSTKYCLASITPPPEITKQIIGNYSNLMSHLVMRWSYCIPNSCPAIILQKVLNDGLREFGLNVSVTESDCDRGNSKSISTADYVGISIWATFVAFAVFSTIYDVVLDKTGGRKKEWLLSFSIYKNGKNLLKTDISQDTMRPIHGLRFLSICWVVLGHRYFFTATSSILNLTDFAEYCQWHLDDYAEYTRLSSLLRLNLRKMQSQFYVQGVLAVDTFFLLSGLLNCYHLLKVLEELRRFPVTKYYIHRYIRLTPALAAIVLMYATWYSHIGDGPVWNQTTSVWAQNCKDNWWPTLLYINNYYNPVTQCAGQSWYLAVDMQLYWLCPLIVIPLWKWPKIGKLLLSALFLASTVSQFLIAYIHKFRMPFSFGVSPEELEEVTKLIYVPTHTRATPYIIGVSIGYYLCHLKKNKIPLVLSKGHLCFGWLLSTVVALSVLFGNYQFSRPLVDHPYNRWESSFYIALRPVGWAMSVGWIIIVCVNNQGGIVNAILSFRAFIPLSRLTYCIFLCHMPIQQYNFGTVRTTDYFQAFNQVHSFFGDLVFSVMAAVLLNLVFESPILVLEKLTRRKPQERLQGEVNNGFQDCNRQNS